MHHLEAKATVMIVDDEPENLHVLHDILRSQGYRVAAFPRGNLALKAAVAIPPDVVLLDIRMPDMDGYEVCRRFKADAGLRDIPILFLSALTRTLEKVDAFKAGAVDYLQKPVNEAEVLARVETHLRLRHYALGLESLVQERTAALVEANHRLKILDDAKTDWLNMISHELRTPLTGILGISELLFSEISKASHLQDLKLVYETSRRRIQELIDGAELLIHLNVTNESFPMIRTPLPPLLASVTREVEKTTGVHCLLSYHGIGDRNQVLAETQLLHRALANLLHTATCCVAVGGGITVVATACADSVRITYRTDGPNLKESSLGTFFEVCGQRETLTAGGDFGLRPALGRRIIRLFGGDATVRNMEPNGIEITVTLPTTGESADNEQFSRPIHNHVETDWAMPE